MELIIVALAVFGVLYLLAVVAPARPSPLALRAELSVETEFTKMNYAQVERLSAQLSQSADLDAVNEHLAFAREMIENADKVRNRNMESSAVSPSLDEVMKARSGIHQAVSRISAAREILRTHGINVTLDDV